MVFIGHSEGHAINSQHPHAAGAFTRLLDYGDAENAGLEMREWKTRQEVAACKTHPMI